jgi:hypothetical protein
VELKDKFVKISADDLPKEESDLVPEISDAYDALLALGFSMPDIRNAIGKIQGGRIGLGTSKSIVKYKDFIVGGKGVQSMPVSPQDRMTTTWAKIKRNY